MRSFDRFVSGFLAPPSWPLWLRRAFLLTIPLSGPIWLALVILGLFVFVAGGTLIVVLAHIATPFFYIGKWLICDVPEAFRELWSRP